MGLQFRASRRDRDGDTLVFFDAADSEDASLERAANAKAVCTRCPAIEPCIPYTLAANEPFGVWGGLTEHERRQDKWFHPPRPQF